VFAAFFVPLLSQHADPIKYPELKFRIRPLGVRRSWKNYFCSIRSEGLEGKLDSFHRLSIRRGEKLEGKDWRGSDVNGSETRTFGKEFGREDRKLRQGWRKREEGGVEREVLGGDRKWEKISMRRISEDKGFSSSSKVCFQLSSSSQVSFQLSTSS
jgi:hypothetical protein